jgi:DNA gyrase subunit A
MGNLLNNDNIQSINIEETLQSSYLDYSMSVIVGRALPDVRDGLKPVHRRILYAMDKLSLSHGAKFKKSARIVGDVIGQYHPHGDTAVYDALVRMAQDFSMRMELVDGQGNFGSVDGDSAAAMRYTEARMTKYAGELLKDLEKNTVNMIDNYDGTTVEPDVMPTRVPNILINGSSGIAVGMATNIPPHNPKEVMMGLKALLADPDIELYDLMEHIKAPDFPTGGTIFGKKGIIDAYESGRGRIKVRAKTHIEKKGNKDVIVIDELPYQVNKARLIYSI